jgi:integrase/recombinase XerD
MHIELKPLQHRHAEWMGIYCSNNTAFNTTLKKELNAKWSKTHQCWYIPLAKEYYHRLKEIVPAAAVLKTEQLKTFLQSRHQQSSKPRAAAVTPKETPVIKQNTIADTPIHPVNNEVLPAMEQHLLLKAYSPSTIKTYLNEMRQLLIIIRQKPADGLTVAELKRYLVYCFDQLKLSEHTIHSRLNALKFYYEQVLRREKFFWEIPRPKKTTELPKIFNQEEIAAIINSLKNKKHKTMLMLAYSAGLRVSEVVALKTFEIDSKRMTIFIKQAKGKKDRMVALSPVLLVMLREYAAEYKPHKKGYLFEGNTKGTAYSTRSLQEVLQAAKSKAGVLKPGSIHTLRHSFATHLVDKGTDVTMIQKLLGHNDLKTTLRYLHTSNKDLLKIISPLDNLNLT